MKTNTSKVTIFEGDTANILCTVSGMPTPTIKWLFNNKIIRKTGLLSISKASDEESGIYKCLGENDLGNSSTSVIVEVLDAVPGKPLNFTWIEREEKSITLSWRPGYQGKSAITFYLLREVNKENETKVNGNKSRYTVIDLKPSTAYRFRLTACNAIGCGDAYASLDAETAEQGE